MDCVDFQADISGSKLAETEHPQDCADMLKLYDTVMRELIDIHIPM